MKKHASFGWSGLFSTAITAICVALPFGLMAGDVPVPTASPAAPGATFTAAAPSLPYGVTEVVKMFPGGIGKDVLVNYIENSNLPFHLNADGIIYLQHLGLPQEVTSVMLHRDGELQKMAATYQQPPPAVAPAAPAPAPVAVPSAPAPVAPYAIQPDVSAPVVYPDYSVYPYYGYPYYYGPNVIVAGGWGWGWGGRGFAHGGFGRGGHR